LTIADDNWLGRDARPRFFVVGNATALDLRPPPPRHAVALRVWARSLAGMQKEALVASSASGAVWRLVSDEGPYLNGFDEAPFPLAFMSAGLGAACFAALAAQARRHDFDPGRLEVTLDSYYTMEGSALRGTMTGAALAPELHVAVSDGAPASLPPRLVTDAIRGSAVDALLAEAHDSRFSLTHNGRQIPAGRVTPLPGPVPADPATLFDRLTSGDSATAGAPIRKTRPATSHGGDGGQGSSLRSEQKRQLHVRASCGLRSDGLTRIGISLFSPSGSSFELLSEEPAAGIPARAPDAATLMAAGIAFCFMTQLGRYATITKRPLSGYRVVQDTHLSAMVAAAGADRGGRADAVETHVFVDSADGDEFARELVDMGEQTCFLHALCRTALALRTRTDG
jgi:organic hydroperoxide reductase OsmC/OhrA